MIASPSPQAATVLIVDDQPLNIQALAQLLKDEYRILVANNGAMALDIAARTELLDLVLLDVTMPAMDGYEVCRCLRADEKTQHLPIIFITAHDSQEDENRGFALGASDYIGKPFRPSVVKARVRTHINLKRRTDALERLAWMDGLTGIPNRRYLDQQLAKQWKQCARNQAPMGLLMVDIDHFKDYNDCHGHAAGDDCLRHVAQAMQKALRRPLDFLARYGGEEFLAVLPDTNGEGVRQLALTMLEAVHDLRLPHGASPIASHVTVSLGCACQMGMPGEDYAPLLKAADMALYLAKQQGRAQVQGPL